MLAFLFFSLLKFLFMKKLYFLFFLTIGFFANAQIVNIPDANFMYWLLTASPSNTIASTETPVFNFAVIQGTTS